MSSGTTHVSQRHESPGNMGGVPSMNDAALDLDTALSEIAGQHGAGTGAASVLDAGDETFSVSNETTGTIITDTKRDTWRFSDAVKHSLQKWVARKERTLKRALTDTTIATKKIAPVTTRVETVKKAATNIAPGDGVASLVKTPVVTKRETRSTPVSSIRVKPKDVPKEIGETKPRWKYIVESDESKEDAAPTVVPTVVASMKPAALLEAPETPLLPEHTSRSTPTVIAREYRPKRTNTVMNASTATTVAAPAAVATPVAPTPKPVAPITQPSTTPASAPDTTVISTLTPPTIASEAVVETTPDTSTDTFASLLQNRNEILSSADGVTGSETTPAAAMQMIPKRGTFWLLGSAPVLLVLFLIIVGVSNFVWSQNESETTTEITSEAVVTLFPTTQTITADTAVAFIPLLVQESSEGEVSYRLINSSGASVPSTSLFPQFSGASTLEIGRVGGDLFVVATYLDRDTALGIMLQAERGIDRTLLQLFNVTTAVQFSDRALFGVRARVAQSGERTVFYYHVTDGGAIIIANTETALSQLIDLVK